MELEECVERRRSVREFEEGEVPYEVLMEALRIGNLAPSAGNLQSRDFVVVTDAELKDELRRASFGQRFLVQAPVVIVCCGNLDRVRKYGERGRKLYTIMDVAASVSFISLYLTSRGYGSCWVGCFDEAEVSRAIGLPDTVRPLTLLAAGRPAWGRERPGRLNIDDLVHWERW